jgi:hypothetical protein
MDPAAESIIQQFEYMLKMNYARKAWDLQGDFAQVYNRFPPGSHERMVMWDLWERMRLKWS